MLPFRILESVFFRFIEPLIWELVSKLAVDPVDLDTAESLFSRSGKFSSYSSVGSIFQIRTVWSAEHVARFFTSGESSNRVK